MATKKAGSNKKNSDTTTVKTIRAGDSVEVDTHSASASDLRISQKAQNLPNNIVNIILIELLGTMILTLVALFAAKETGALYVGLALTVLTFIGGAISGGHYNPAVTFAMLTMRRLRPILAPFYIAAQLLGGMLAVIVLNLLTNNSLKLNFGHFWNNGFTWPIFGVEFVGAAVFLFALTAVTSRTKLFSEGSRAFGVGLSLTIGIVVASSLLAAVQGAIDTSTIKDVKEVPHELRVKGATLNPAVAIAATEQTDGGFTGSRSAEDVQYSRFSAEVILGTLLGAALGGNLYLLVAGRQRQ